MVGWHGHELNGHEQTPGDGDGQGGLVCCSPWGHKESDTTERLNNKQHHEPALFFRFEQCCQVLTFRAFTFT